MKTGIIKAISTDIVGASMHAGASGNLNPSSPAPWASCIIFQEEERCVASEDSAEQREKTKTQKKEQDPRRHRGSPLSSSFFIFFSSLSLSLSLFIVHSFRFASNEDICFRVRRCLDGGVAKNIR